MSLWSLDGGSLTGGLKKRKPLSQEAKSKAKKKCVNKRAKDNAAKYQMHTPARHFERGHADRSDNAQHSWTQVLKAKKPRGSLAYWRRCSKRAQKDLSGRTNAGMNLCKRKKKSKKSSKKKSPKQRKSPKKH